MNSATADLLQTYWGMATGALFFLAPGYVLGRASDLMGFRTRSAPEKLLWSVVLSIPLSLAITAVLGRWIPSAGTIGLFHVLALVALLLLFTHRERASADPARSLVVRALWIAGALAILLPLLTADFQAGHRVFQSTVVYDWSVRIPMVRAAMHQRVPPMNPLSALDGQPAPLRYYYYWYVLCAQLANMAHISARSGFAASCVWAAFGFLAIVFLYLKYIVGIRERLQAKCLLAMFLLCVIGLDLLPAIRMLGMHGVRLWLDMEWWRSDRSPSWIGTSLYAPHHIAGLVCCLVGFLLVVCSPQAPTKWKLSLHAVIAGICFATAAGASTYMTFTFVIVCALWSLRALIKREWLTLAVFAGVAVTAYALSRAFLHELGSGSSGTTSFATIKWRSNDFAHAILRTHHLETGKHALDYILRQPVVLLLDFAEYGFFWFVFADQLRRDWPRRGALAVREQAHWVIFLGASIAAFFVSSGTGSSPNDLGMHAGMILKFTLLLWAVPWSYAAWEQRRGFAILPVGRKIFLAAAAACLAIGLAGEALHLTLQRTLFPLQEAGIIAKRTEWFPVTHLSYRVYAVRDAYAQSDALLPPDGIVQFNPDSRLSPAMMIFATHQLAAADAKCGTPFGGNAAKCDVVYPQLRVLFGNSPHGRLQDGKAPFVAKADALAAICSELKLAAVYVDSSDLIWWNRESWVWTAQPFYANSSVRVMACPTK